MTEHALTRINRSATGLVRTDRSVRPDTDWACTCGQALPGNSRRKARHWHRAHRAGYDLPE